MPSKKDIQKELSGYISNLFRTHFGKGPSAVYVVTERPFITIHFSGFLAAMEDNLMNQDEEELVLTTRDLIIDDLKPEITQYIEAVSGHRVKEFYADWNLAQKTGLIIGIVDERMNEENLKASNGVDEQALRSHLTLASERMGKIPESMDIYWLNNRTILVQRSGILTAIEKELVMNGYTEQLRLSRHLLEHKALQEVPLESALKHRISEMFLDWDFEADLSYTVFRLKPEER